VFIRFLGFVPGPSWSFVRVWAPSSFIIAVILVLVCSLTFYLYYIASMFFSCKDEKPYFLLIVLSLVSGFGNALNIFVINEAVNREDSLKSGLYLYFIFGLLIYICIQKYIRTRMVTITNELVYSKRMVLVQEILKTPFHRLENLENGKIHAGLNNDTETLSNFANIIITGATGAVTLICCFIYLGVLNFTALLLSMLVIFMAAGLYFAIGRVASRVWEQTRDITECFLQVYK
jgi:ABC-type siderophore export system fused ATPase/permease subunit